MLLSLFDKHLLTFSFFKNFYQQCLSTGQRRHFNLGKTPIYPLSSSYFLPSQFFFLTLRFFEGIDE